MSKAFDNLNKSYSKQISGGINKHILLYVYTSICSCQEAIEGFLRTHNLGLQIVEGVQTLKVRLSLAYSQSFKPLWGGGHYAPIKTQSLRLIQVLRPS